MSVNPRNKLSEITFCRQKFNGPEGSGSEIPNSIDDVVTDYRHHIPLSVVNVLTYHIQRRARAPRIKYKVLDVI